MKSIIKKVKFILEIFLHDFFDFGKINLFLKVYPYSMAGYKRLSNVYTLANKVKDGNLDGDFVECGVWKGGCSAIMAYIANSEAKNRKTWLFDSFEGLPEPTKEDGDIAKQYAQNKAGGNLKSINQCVGPLEDVKKILFGVLKMDEKNVIIKKGWFQNVLPITKKEIDKISILRLDGDWYDSTKCCLDNLYDNVIIGGYIIIDDYGHWEGAKKALDEFFKARGILPELIKIDYTGVYFIKK